MQINDDDIYKTSSNLHLDKFKTFCEYLFPDFKRNKCSYHEFDCLIKLISGSIEFDTLHIFIEIVGKKKSTSLTVGSEYLSTYIEEIKTNLLK